MTSNLVIKNVDPAVLRKEEVIVQSIQSLRLNVGHLKNFLSSIDPSPLDWKAFKKVCPKLDGAAPEDPDTDQVKFMSGFLKNFFPLLQAMSYYTSSAADFCPENAAEIACMINQTGSCKYDMFLGRVPEFVPVSEEYKDMGIKVCRGMGVISQPFVDKMKELTNKAVVPVPFEVVNYSVCVAVTQHIDQAGKVQPSTVLPNDIDVGKWYFNGMLRTNLNGVASEMMEGSRISGINAIMLNLMKSAPDVYAQLSRLDPEACGPSGQQLGGDITTIANRKFGEIQYGTIYAYNDKLWKAMSKRKAFLKRVDCGHKSLNVAAKFSPVLSMLVGSPFMKLGKRIVKNPDFEGAKVKCCYFGAGGQRGRQVFDNRMDVDAFDIAEPLVLSTKSLADQFRNLDMKTWTKKDIFGFSKYEGYQVFVSDIYISHWSNAKGLDPLGHKFVSNALKGKVVNDEILVSDKLPPTRIVKGFVPGVEDFKHYEGAYPFMVCDTSRPCTLEVIYAKTTDKQFDLEKGACLLDKYYDIPQATYSIALSKRFCLVQNVREFENFCTRKLVRCIQEITCQVRSWALNFKIVFGSIRNRDWWIASDDLPQLYVSKKWGMGIHQGTSINSGIFEDLMGIMSGSGDNVYEKLPPIMPLKQEPASVDDGGVENLAGAFT